MSGHSKWNLLNECSKIAKNEFLAILENEFNKLYIEWPRMLYPIYIINSNATIIRAKYI